MKQIKSISSILLGVFVCFAALYLQSCDDDTETDITAQEEQEIAEYSTIADNSVDEELQAVEETEFTESEGGRLKDNCVVVTRDTLAKTVTLDFGTGCVGRYGRERTGKVIITYTDGFGTRLSGRTITFDNYHVNNRKIEGTISLRNFDRTDEGNLTATREVIDYTVTFPDGNNFVLNGSTTREWIEGEGDDINGNERIRITGEYEGISSRGRSFRRTITDPIIADFACRLSGGFLRVSGTEEFTITNARRARARIVNYGSGDCDNEISVNVNGTDVNVSVD